MHSYIHTGGTADSIRLFPSAQEQILIEYRTLRSARYIPLENDKMRLLIDFDDFSVEVSMSGPQSELDELMKLIAIHCHLRVREEKGEGTGTVNHIVIHKITYAKKGA